MQRSKIAVLPLLLMVVFLVVLHTVAYSGQFDGTDQAAIETVSESPQERSRATRDGGKIYRNRVTPNWIDGTPKFWYRNDLTQGGREFILVDASLGTRLMAFDHEAVAKSLGNDIKSTHLPIERLVFQQPDQIILVGKDKSYRWDSQARVLVEVDTPSPEASNRPTRSNARSAAGEDSSITFVNRTKGSVEIFWLNGEGGKQSYGKIEAGMSRDQHTFGGHRWLIVNAQGESLGEVTAQDSHSSIVIDGQPIKSNPQPRRRPGPAGPRDLVSPDGKWRASVEQHNVVIERVDSDESSTEKAKKVVLTKDGSEANSYGNVAWSPDSTSIVAFREKKVEKLPVNWIRSSPPEGGRAKLETRPYVLPGDPFPVYELNILRVETRESIKPAVDGFEHEWLRPRVRFHQDGSRFTYEQTDRGHGRFRLIEVQTQDGSVRNIVDEKTDTFIWTAHTENQNLQIVQWLASGDEILYTTEKYGWRQLLLIDAATGVEKRSLTPKGIVLRSVESIDEPNRTVWFSASGRDSQDPYLVHYGYVSLDTGNLTWITEGNGNHTIQFSPNRDFVIDSYSRVDLAPITELRRVSDGSKICELENSDITELKSSGWSAPEVFVSKGRDNETDIWGIICRPKNFDPNKKYPVIEDIYAGPQSSYVPKTFSPTTRYESLTNLGFIVVKLDGMGTANRSKAFHDVCWKNLKDSGFEDRIRWMQAAAFCPPAEVP